MGYYKADAFPLKTSVCADRLVGNRKLWLHWPVLGLFTMVEMGGRVYWILALRTNAVQWICTNRGYVTICIFFPKAHGDFTPASLSKRQRCEKKIRQFNWNHRKHWCPAVGWRLGWCIRHRPTNGLALMLPTAKTGKRQNDIDHELQIGPVHFIFINGSFRRNSFNGIASTMFNAMIC